MKKNDNATRQLPAYPLFVKDPYFSIWSMSENLNTTPQMWFGEPKGVYGIVRYNNTVYSFLGGLNGADELKNNSIKLTAFTTDYEFENDDIILEVSFVSPLNPTNLLEISCPVCYMNYSVEFKTDVKDFKIMLALNQNICSNAYNKKRRVRGAKFEMDKYNVSWFGLAKQEPLSHAEDTVGADWGYYYLAGENAYFFDENGFNAYIFNNELIRYFNDDIDKYIIAESFQKNGKILIAFDDTVSINYFGDWLKGYYFKDGKNIFDAIDDVFENSQSTDKELALFDQKMKQDADKISKDYYKVLVASLRQSIGAHKLVEDKMGNLLFLSKENNSNGCIATVDVSYPSIPLYLYYNPELVNAMIRPIFKFASYPIWKYDFAPHDVGTYPYCCGQVYGLNEAIGGDFGNYRKTKQWQTHANLYMFPKTFDLFNFKWQMPVEESSNIIIMLYAVIACGGSENIAKDNYDTLKLWANYLVNNGLYPEDQLCTDDFAGHMAQNINLAIKATVGLQCMAEIARRFGKVEDFNYYNGLAAKFANSIESFGEKYKYLPMTYDCGEETFSLKYNLAFDKLLALNLFGEKTYAKESECYMEKLNTFGVPLDSRMDFTKSDWEMWAASLTEDREKQEKIMRSIINFFEKTPDRVPFGDWYETKDAKFRAMKNRSVQGAMFILLLKEKLLDK